MKFSIFAVASLALATDIAGAFSFTGQSLVTKSSSASGSRLNMVLEKPKEKAKVKKISKLEILKTNSDNLVHPLQEVSLPTSTDSAVLFSVCFFVWGSTRSLRKAIRHKQIAVKYLKEICIAERPSNEPEQCFRSET